MKGFATIMVAASVFVVAILLLSNNPTENVLYSSNFSEMKVRITNYEIVMLEGTQDCNWDKSELEINQCLDIISNDAKQIFKVPYTTCTIGSFSSVKANNVATTQIACTTIIDSGNEGYFSNELKKKIQIKNYP